MSKGTAGVSVDIKRKEVRGWDDKGFKSVKFFACPAPTVRGERKTIKGEGVIRKPGVETVWGG